MQWVMILTCFVLYGMSILFTSLVGHGVLYGDDVPEPRAAREAFATVPMSFYSLFKLMNGDTDVIEPLSDESFGTPGCVGKLLFMFFMIISNWAILAILTSVVSD